MSDDRDVEKSYLKKEHIAKLERLVESLKAGKAYTIQVDGERLYVPARAELSIEHERNGDQEELEFQLRWTRS
ncbi:amphi-Trp domain-containing protein [Alterisphingorhabdus coralli]|uniref:Amphi-Trp domain-containing protein n=1 Tax=Alterisphingorhabdus coralli TaxID=3071408 RepID=A0AA97F812_9SPHN|nr:amphi-Trp domain-containing protein [Parasphingorhabdus sp. SCSIO 66989]WOE75881.1 amphi-Trp domain-containing protein [Parasphingorhabdus sp. SCSIO 66989]